MNQYHQQCCQHHIDELMKSPMTQPLRVPVDPVKDSAPNYLKVIKNPMDLGTIKKKLRTNQYQSVDEFVSDIKLVCDNSITYNGKNSMLGMIADDIMAMTNKWKENLSSCYEEQWFKDQQEGAKKLEEHLKNAPSCVTFQPDYDLPEDFSLDNYTDEQKESIKPLLEPYEIDDIVNIWAFILKDKRMEIFKILGLPEPENEE